MRKRGCDCKHAFQDRRYGRGVRIMNETMKNKRSVFRCTVCKREH